MLLRNASSIMQIILAKDFVFMTSNHILDPIHIVTLSWMLVSVCGGGGLPWRCLDSVSFLQRRQNHH